MQLLGGLNQAVVGAGKVKLALAKHAKTI